MFASKKPLSLRIKTGILVPTAICAYAVVCGSHAYAQSPATQAENTATLPSSALTAATAAEVQKISENMTILQAQLNQLELKTKIAMKQRELDTQGGGSAISSFGTKNGNPSVVSVSGVQGSLKAVLVFPGGVNQRVQEGDVIDDRRVSKISVNEVILTDLKGKKSQRLAFGSTPTMREVNTPAAGLNGMPLPQGGMPPGPMTR